MVSDKELIKEFMLANLEQFQDWLDVEHDICGSEAEDIIEKGLSNE